ncbi:zinc ABC transporter substrate-binding protein [Marivirga sp. S37H4]|uniref:Zinc ABC transporter substrate-binding protein n=2 Tax=Marivirga aurantiaca TaxID=2802615 RepID=A0A935C784_9BACT|nr:zinc ABC transporter substrate-binding protein [Marivirga aurantiaca]
MYTLFKVLIITLVLTSCGEERERKEGELYIVCTTGMIADGVKNIVQDRAKVDALMGPGVDPHLYKATHGDLLMLQDADIIVYNGLFLEGKMGDIMRQMSRKKTVIAVAESLPTELLINSTAFQGTYDPHVWFDVSLWNKALSVLPQKISAFDSTYNEEYKQNYLAYSQQLDSLHKAVKERISLIPEERRILVTAHDAFEYFGKAYSMEVKGLQGISTLSEYGLRDVSNLVDFIVEHNIPAIYTETSVSKKAIEAVVEGCRGKGHKVTIGGSLYSDAMGQSGTDEGTYIGMVNANVKQIYEGLVK